MPVTALVCSFHQWGGQNVEIISSYLPWQDRLQWMKCSPRWTPDRRESGGSPGPPGPRIKTTLWGREPGWPELAPVTADYKNISPHTCIGRDTGRCSDTQPCSAPKHCPSSWDNRRKESWEWGGGVMCWPDTTRNNSGLRSRCCACGFTRLTVVWCTIFYRFH